MLSHLAAVLGALAYLGMSVQLFAGGPAVDAASPLGAAAFLALLAAAWGTHGLLPELSFRRAASAVGPVLVALTAFMSTAVADAAVSAIKPWARGAAGAGGAAPASPAAAEAAAFAHAAVVVAAGLASIATTKALPSTVARVAAAAGIVAGAAAYLASASAGAHARAVLAAVGRAMTTTASAAGGAPEL
jgi:hypothetical protein